MPGPDPSAPATHRRRTRTPVAVAVALAVAVGAGAWSLRDRVDGDGGTRARGDAAVVGVAPDPAGGARDCAGRAAGAPRELRGMWITTVNNIDWPSRRGLPTATVQAEFRAWLDLAVRNNHNAVFVHVRPSGDALWPSSYAPWSEWLTGRRDGRDPGWDPMEFMVAEAHARNLEFHAWFNPYRGGQPATVGGPGPRLDQLAPTHPLRRHRDWVVTYPSADRPGSRLYFNPGIPQARAFVEDSMLEAVRRYDVDGVHFDDFFYPYPEAGQDFPDDAAFARYGRGFPDKHAWRRHNVNTLVREMSERIKAIKPWVKFGISPFGIWRNKRTDPAGSATAGLQSYDAIYADTRLWVREQWLDYVVPQLYWHIGFDKADYAKLLPWWTATVKGTRVQLYIGQADYRVGERGAWRDPAELDRQLALNRRHGVHGSVHFSAKQVRADKLGAVSRYRAAHYAGPALLPTMAQLPAAPPAAPTVTGTRRADGGGVELAWRGDGATSFAVYRVDGDAARLVGTTRDTGWVDRTAPARGPLTYCVSGLDRSGNEGGLSAPAAVAG
ncbi:family 10 glycosylhydrolase [Micromonospora sp. C28SCA-DRY-2]|uniref:glycoside hydrolase family 10 protein n=1 Tax=Micromonospora sp. C28SCA-DRY-2 TaxID=3059522 RepID=UPI00267701CC|nr:family 10 glycosylhydrolase [Micromonospora sp. C28SCA-DRY-2]MDO3700143.1 family 10 glycosylhydrolase [Micromonospora sp. C28SCA-DRY-2]